MKCCICLEDYDKLVHDGRCSEGICLRCFKTLNFTNTINCPNCRQTFPWIKPLIEQCHSCRRHVDSSKLTHVLTYVGKPYQYYMPVCTDCREVYGVRLYRFHSKIGTCKFCWNNNDPNGYVCLYDEMHHYMICGSCYNDVYTPVDNARTYFKSVMHELMFAFNSLVIIDAD